MSEGKRKRVWESKDWLYPLRKFHGEIHELILKQQRIKKLKKYIKHPKGVTAYILGSPDYENLGDSAILLAQILFLHAAGWDKEHIKELTFREYREYRKTVKKTIDDGQPIFGMGGGNMGNQWPVEEKFRYDMMDDFLNNPITIFPQTIYFLPGSKKEMLASVPYYNERKNLTLVARERKSFEIMQTLYPQAKILLTPDIVLSTTMDNYGVERQERKGALLCVRSDVEKSVSDDVWIRLGQELDKQQLIHRKTDMYSDCLVTKENRMECVRKKMQEFCGAELVITDRLHGMVFSAITGTPCIVFSNYNQKVKGTYDWIHYLPYIRYVETMEEAIAAIPELIVMKECEFDNTPLLKYYEKLAEVVKESGYSKCNCSGV